MTSSSDQARVAFEYPSKAKLIAALGRDHGLTSIKFADCDDFFHDLDDALTHCTDMNVKRARVFIQRSIAISFPRTLALADYLESLVLPNASGPDRTSLRGTASSSPPVAKKINILYILNDLFFHLNGLGRHPQAAWFPSCTRTLHPTIVRIISSIAAHDRSSKTAAAHDDLGKLLELWTSSQYFSPALMADLKTAMSGKSVDTLDKDGIDFKASRGTPIFPPPLHGTPFPTPSRSLRANDDGHEHPCLLPPGAAMASRNQGTVGITSLRPVDFGLEKPSPDMLQTYAAFKKQADKFEPLPAVAVFDDAGTRADDKLCAPDLDGLGNPLRGEDGRPDSAVTAYGMTADFVRRHRSRLLFDAESGTWPVPEATPPSPPMRGLVPGGGHRGGRGGHRGGGGGGWRR